MGEVERILNSRIHSEKNLQHQRDCFRKGFIIEERLIPVVYAICAVFPNNQTGAVEFV